MPLPAQNKRNTNTDFPFGIRCGQDEQERRTQELIGKKALGKLHKAKVALFGLGGVGSYVLEALARSGIGKFVLTDGDRIAVSNINRQLLALHSTVGQLKTEEARKRITDINPQVQVQCLDLFYDKKTASETESYIADCSYIVDAIDTVESKLLLIETADRLHIPVISCMGTGNKTDPSRFEIADIFQTSVCPLARIMRHELKKRGIRSLKTIFSKEIPSSCCRPPASIAFVPAVAGLLIAAETVKDIIACKESRTDA